MKKFATLAVLAAALFVSACAHTAPFSVTPSTAVSGAASAKWDGKSPNLDPSCQGFGC